MKRVSLLLLTIVVGLTLHNAWALDEAHGNEIVVEGKVYHAPVMSEELILLKEVTEGNEQARQELLLDKTKRMIFLGDTDALWIELTKDALKVYKPEKR